MKKYAPMLEAFLQAVANYVQANQMVNCCEQCGATEGVEAYLANGHFHALCPACHGQLSAQVTSQMPAKKGNFVAGIVGALLGSLVACWLGCWSISWVTSRPSWALSW